MPISRRDGLARQPRVGVERDDVADAGGHARRLPSTARKWCRSRRAAAGSARAACRACAPSRSTVPSPSFQTRRRWSSRKRVAAGRRPVAPVQPRDALGGSVEQRLVALGVSRSRRRSSRRAARNADRLPGSRGNGSPAARSAPRSLRASSAASAPRPACADAAARRRAAPGPAAASAPNSRVTPRFTSATADIDRRESAPSSQRARQPAPVQRRSAASSEQRQGEHDRGDNGDRADIAADAERRLDRPSQARSGGRKPIAASNARTPAGDQVIARIARAVVRSRRRPLRLLRGHDGASRDLDLGASEPRASSSMALR